MRPPDPPREPDQEPTDEREPLERLRGSVGELIEPFEPVGEDDWDALRDSCPNPEARSSAARTAAR